MVPDGWCSANPDSRLARVNPEQHLRAGSGGDDGGGASTKPRQDRNERRRQAVGGGTLVGGTCWSGRIQTLISPSTYA